MLLVIPNTLFPTGVDGGHPQFSYLLSIAFYDWVRRAGDVVNVQNLVSTLNAPLTTDGRSSNSQLSDAAGRIDQTHVIRCATTELFAQNNQWRALSGLGFNSSNGSKYDLQISNFVWQQGRMYGDKHGGEPLDKPGVLVANGMPYTPTPATAVFENPNLMYEAFPARTD